MAASIGPRTQSTTTAVGTEINAWIVIDKDGTVTLRIPHTEMGQGGLTSVAMLIAEELNVDWSKIKTEFADANRHLRNNKEYKVMSTHGSQLVRLQHPHLMGAGASARERLKQAAAEAWGVDRSQIEAKLGRAHGGRPHRHLWRVRRGRGQGQARQGTGDQDRSGRRGGCSASRSSASTFPNKVNGSAQYAIDTRVPGMVYAAVKASPVPWGTLKSYNFDAIKDRPGVIAAVPLKAVPGKRDQPDLQDAVAVVADSWYRAKTALELLPVEWDFGDSAETSSAGYFAEGHRLMEQKGLISGKEDPMAAEIIAAAKKRVTASYQRPFETHARMEPINATVHVQPDRVDVWSPTQDQSAAITLVADQLGVDPKTVYAHTMFLGGGFGGNGGGGTGVTRQAAEISKQIGKPVKVIWPREEDLAQDKQRPLAVAKLSAAIGDDGLPTALFTRAVWFVHRRHQSDRRRHRGLRHLQHAVQDSASSARAAQRQDSHPELDASRARRQPARFHGRVLRRRDGDRRRMGSARMAPQDDRRAWPIGSSCSRRSRRSPASAPTFRRAKAWASRSSSRTAPSRRPAPPSTSAAAAGSRSRRSWWCWTRAVSSIRMPPPSSAKDRSCWELSHAWTGGLELEEGRFVNTNFDTYNLLRIDQHPAGRDRSSPRPAARNGAVSASPAGPPAPPAVANAIYYATGKRIRATPFRSQDLTWTNSV